MSTPPTVTTAMCKPMTEQPSEPISAPWIASTAFAYYPRLARVWDYVRANMGASITLSGAAKVACLETSYFSAYFHRHAGVRFSDWVRHVRVCRAVEFLSHRDYSVAEVARLVGFGSTRAMERAFVRELGMPPRGFKATVAPAQTSLREGGTRARSS